MLVDKIIDNYLEEQMIGYKNYLQDRYVISNNLKKQMTMCFSKKGKTIESQILFYKCQVGMFSKAIKSAEAAKNKKCDLASKPEVCEKIYDGFIGNLQSKISFSQRQIKLLGLKAERIKFNQTQN